MGGPADGGNGKVEYGRLLERVDTTVRLQQELSSKFDQVIDRLDQRIDANTLDIAKNKAEITRLKDWVVRMTVVNVTGTTGVIIHGILALLGVKP